MSRLRRWLLAQYFEIEPNEEHWHGATPDRFMAHVAIQEADENGQVVTWGDQVADEEYEGRLP